MNFPRAPLIFLPCPVVAALCTPFVAVDASPCLPSAEAVRQDYPGAWPSWTMRTPGHEGEKCWYPSTRAAARDHRNGTAPDDDTSDTTQSTTKPRTRSSGLPASLAVLYGAATIGSTPIVEESSFAERFAAVTPEDRHGLSSIMRFMIDPVGSGP